MPLSKTTRSKIKQTRLQFSPLSSSSPAKEKYSDTVQDRLANIRYEGVHGRRSVGQQDLKAERESLPTPEPSSQPPHESTEPVSSPLSEPPSSPINLPQENHTLETDEEEYEVQLPSSKRRKSTQQSTTAEPTPSRKSTRLQSRPVLRHRESTSSSQTADAVETASPRRQLSDLGSPETSGDEDDIMVTKPVARRRQSKPTNDDAFVVDDDRIDYILSDEEPVRQLPAKRGRSVKDGFVVDNDVIEYISSDEETATPSKSQRISRSHKSPRTPRHRSRREQAELEDDLEDLQDSDTATKKTRTRGGPVTTQRDKAREHLELLRRRRAGEQIPRVEDSEEKEEEPEGIELDFIGRPTDFDELSGRGSAHSSTESEPEVFDEAEGDDDFVEIDSPSGGRLPHPDIPLEFTSYATAKPKELFPYLVEWLVKNRIAPAFPRNDPIWRLAFDKIGDQVTAQAGSRLISAAWNTEFKWVVMARPGIKVETLSGFQAEDDIHNCDACNKTNHPALYDFVFSGQAYNKDSLEPIENDSEDENDENQNDNVSYDEKGHCLAPSSRHFYLGRFCAANAEMGHKLTHWKYHLNENLLSYLEEQGVLSAEAIVAREKLNKKKRERVAEAIVDEMQATGVITQLWRDFQNDLEDARLGMEGYEKKGGRSRGRVGTVRSGKGEDGVVREWRADRAGMQVRDAFIVESESE